MDRNRRGKGVGNMGEEGEKEGDRDRKEGGLTMGNRRGKLDGHLFCEVVHAQAELRADPLHHVPLAHLDHL